MVHIKGIPRSVRFRRPRYLCLDVEDEFPWGEHRNRTVRWVLANNPAYVAWIVDTGGDSEMNIRFSFTERAMRILGAAKQSHNYVPDMFPREFYKQYRKLVTTDGKQI